jgi:hypothetical protein
LPTGVANDDIEATQALNRTSDEFLTKLLIAKIAGDCYPDAAFGLDQVDDFLGVRLFSRKIVDRDVRAFACVGDGSCATHAGIAASYQRFATGKTT